MNYECLCVLIVFISCVCEIVCRVCTHFQECVSMCISVSFSSIYVYISFLTVYFISFRVCVCQHVNYTVAKG